MVGVFLAGVHLEEIMTKMVSSIAYQTLKLEMLRPW